MSTTLAPLSRSVPFLTRLHVSGLLVLLLAVPLQAREFERIERLAIVPSEILLDSADAQRQLVVTGHLEGDALRDLTGTVHIAIEPSGVARVSETGVVTPIADGHATLYVHAGSVEAKVPIIVTNADQTRAVSYRHDVAAVLSKAGCNMGACHGNLNGKGGFRLSLRGDDPDFDLDMMTRDVFGRRLDSNNPESSLLVRKPAGLEPHEGGRRFAIDSHEARALLAWIKEGTPDDKGSAPRLTRLSVFPEHRINVAPGLTQQLVITAEFSDGTVRDVTHQAAFDVDDPTKVEVDANGRVTRLEPGESVVAVRYLDGRGVSRLAFLPDRPNFAWNGPEPSTILDEAVFEKLKTHKLQPAADVEDSTFLRRAYLDVLGNLPTPEETRAFLDDPDIEKRAKLVDRLLERPEFADYWALKWADLLRNEEKTMGVKGAWTFQRWLRDQFAVDTPLNAFAAQLVSARGSTWNNPPASFYRTNRDPETAAEAVGQVFLGVRLQCARCHNHPFDNWRQDDYYGLAAFFNHIDRKEVNNYRRDRLDTHEINGDEVIFLTGRDPSIKQPRSGETMQPTPLGTSPVELGEGQDALLELAAWLTEDNRQFARNMANRVWFHLNGRGIVEPVDDFRDSNPPSNPELLEALTDEFIENGYRVKPLIALIMKSKVYALSSRPNETNIDDEANFARATVKLLPAEVLLDAIGQAIGKPATFENVAKNTRAVQLAGVQMGGEFLKAFGKPERLLTCECERSESTTLAQAFQLINGETVRGLLVADDNRIGRLLDSDRDDAEILEALYLATLCRFPTNTEREATLNYVSSGDNRRAAWEDIAWALFNSKEFLLRH